MTVHVIEHDITFTKPADAPPAFAGWAFVDAVRRRIAERVHDYAASAGLGEEYQWPQFLATCGVAWATMGDSIVVLCRHPFTLADVDEGTRHIFTALGPLLDPDSHVVTLDTVEYTLTGWGLTAEGQPVRQTGQVQWDQKETLCQ